jgi:hypothetical protein
MTIPSSITIELSSLENQVSAAQPLASASHATRTALKLNAGNLVADIQTALTAAPSILDTFVSPPDAISIIAGVLSVVVAAEDQNTLSLMRGVCGRAASNLDQLP